MELFPAQCVEERVVLHLDRLGGATATVKHTGHLAGMAQAAARTRALRVSFVCYDFHFKLQLSSADRDQSLRTILTQAAACIVLNTGVGFPRVAVNSRGSTGIAGEL